MKIATAIPESFNGAEYFGRVSTQSVARFWRGCELPHHYDLENQCWYVGTQFQNAGDQYTVRLRAESRYYGLVADYEISRQAEPLEVARQFYENNRRQVEIGSMAPLDVTTAESQVASGQNDLVVSQTNLARRMSCSLRICSANRHRETTLLATAHVIPLDKIVVPEREDLAPMNDLVQTALANRSDLAAEKAGLTTAEISALGTQEWHPAIPAAVR